MHCIIKGRVQGIGFRYSALSTARGLKLSGWVRNLADGSVETRAKGSAEQIASYLSWLGSGPPMAQVDQLIIIEHRKIKDESSSSAKKRATEFTPKFTIE